VHAAGKALGARNRVEGACRDVASRVSRGARAAETREAPAIEEEEWQSLQSGSHRRAWLQIRAGHVGLVGPDQ
jgi:hypothetical protein